VACAFYRTPHRLRIDVRIGLFAITSIRPAGMAQSFQSRSASFVPSSRMIGGVALLGARGSHAGDVQTDAINRA
jgi:hypothetical protein